MKTGKDIVCITMTTWEGDYMKTIVHMMTQLAKNHRVLFVDYPFTVKDVASTILGKSKAPVKRMLGINDRLRTLEANENDVYHLTLPPILPINWMNNEGSYQKINQVQSHIVRNSILKAMKTLEFQDPIVINAFNPIIGLPLASKLNESKLIYYCYDEIRAAQWCGKHGGLMEDQFLQKVDEVIVTSEGLLSSKSKKHPSVSLVKNGVDFKLFHEAYHPQMKARKTIGYVGSVDFRLNYELLEHLVERLPEYDFHFVGRITEMPRAMSLDKHANVQFFGAQQPNDITRFMREFDLGIIPFAKNDFTKNIYPLKINEYLSAGLPVISTDFAELSDFESLISIANNADDFETYVLRELEANTSDKELKRIAAAKQNDWSARAELVELILNKDESFAQQA
ncbi:MAG: hypothetical protein CMP48_02885 [Rickettsiales bacterium]|nr:hypothetical protein [Rickettsiales bacterium]